MRGCSLVSEVGFARCYLCPTEITSTRSWLDAFKHATVKLFVQSSLTYSNSRMDCNKEEALRAKAIAEKKLESKDFVGAKKFAVKAQKLYQNLDNISQLLCVCDVHCSAENKMLGHERDWYAILQVEQTADEVLIKKQYRKFALLLHPDKNKLSGAEAAFKLIGEAQSVLLDKDRRAFHDMKRRTSKSTIPTHNPTQGTGYTNNGSAPKVSASSSAAAYPRNTKPTAQPPKVQAQSVAPNGKETFWTLCPFCAVRYQYYKEVLNRALRCQSCKKPFIAYDMSAQGVPQGASVPQHPSNKQETPTQATGKSAAGDVLHGQKTQNQQNSIKEPLSKGRQDLGVGPQQMSDSHKVIPKVDKAASSAGPKPARKVNGKRSKKQVVESSESLDSSSTDMEDDVGVKDGDINSHRFQVGVDSQPRRSSRGKNQVSYGEYVSDEDEGLNPSKRPKACVGENSEASPSKEKPFVLPKFSDDGKGGADIRIEEVKMEDGIQSQRGSKPDGEACPSNSSSEIAPELELHDVPDPDFHDFDVGRKQDCFIVGQLWAAYDTVDAMPRFYARISKVFSPGFKVRITWLEPDPVDEDEIEWVSRDLPFSCGKFKSGHSEDTTDHLMFSHVMSWEKGSGRLSYKIYPRKGETWALFKGWDIKWDHIEIDSSSVTERKYEFDFVEVLSDYDGNCGVRVAYLKKLKGFTCVFVRIMENELQIPPSELLRFSHRVPSFKLTGEERDGVPRGSLELDPAALPANLVEVSLPEKVRVNARNVEFNGSSSKSPGPNFVVNEVVRRAHPCPQNQVIDIEDSADGDAVDESSFQEEFELPDPEFFDFDGLRSLDKFQAGQVWALYSDEDGLPKYYALIKKVDLSSERNKLTIQWLEACELPSDSETTQSKKISVCCGKFRLMINRPKHYADTSAFSHQLQAEPTGKRNSVSIYPCKGEVWALYKNGKTAMTFPNSKKCDYDIVEILDRDASHVKVVILERVLGFNTVFKPCQLGESLRIPLGDLLRFSHQVPCFRVTQEKGGGLNGLLELDPAALPSRMF